MREIIRAKLAPPLVPDHLVPRPRVEALLAALMARERVVWVCATAGAGKTTAVAGAAALDGRPVVWLTLDDPDAAPGRLLTYLEAAISRRLPALDGFLGGVLVDGVSHAEAAALLGQALERSPVVVVIDELERIRDAASALAVISSFGRYAPVGVTLVLVTRQEVRIELGSSSVARHAGIGERELAFTLDETAAALAKLGREGLSAAAVVEATGGWVMGVMFEAWRSEEHVVGTSGEADPLYGYLSQQILEPLSAVEQEFLVRTSIVAQVTAEYGEALGARAAARILAALRAKRLPASWSADGAALRLHSRFREFLQERLERRGSAEVKALRAALARMLLADGYLEEAVEEFLRAGLTEEARPIAERTIDTVIRRFDFELADRWLSVFDRAAIERSPALWQAELMSAIGQWQFIRGAELGDRLRARLAGALEDSVPWEIVALLAWCYHHLGRVRDVRSLLDRAEQPQLTQTLQLLTAVYDSRVDYELPSAVPHPFDVLRICSLLGRGDLRQITELVSSRWSAALSGPAYVSTLRASGRTSEALARCEELVAAGTRSVYLEAISRVEILIDLGRGDEARSALRAGQALIQETGSTVLMLQIMLLDAMLWLRVEREPRRAIEVLGLLEQNPSVVDYAFAREILDCWYGHALLMLGEDRVALARLERAVASMVSGNRALELPTAATYLSEARWRCGDEPGADQAADLALQSCERLGSRHLLLQALADYPAVAARRSDAEAEPDSAWHELGRSLMRQGAPIQLRVGGSIELRDFGPAHLLLNGSVSHARIKKSYELLAYLSMCRAHQATREQLLDVLFVGRDDAAARTYLRQAILQLKDAFGSAEALEVRDGVVGLSRAAIVATDSLRFETLLAEAERMVGEDRRTALLHALELFDRGEYLAGSALEWVDARRERLREAAVEARLALAEISFQLGRYRDARHVAETALRADPYRERGWRLLMRSAGAVGDHDLALSDYRRCRSTFETLGLQPSTETTRLLDELRNTPRLAASTNSRSQSVNAEGG